MINTEKFYYLFTNHYHSVLLDYYNNPKDNNEIKETKIGMLEKKLIHTFKVVQNSLEICEGENFINNVKKLSEISALFHDIGRFTQMIKYGTFKDNISEDHALLSVNVLESMKDDFIQELGEEYYNIIKDSIFYHNKLSIEDLSNPTKVLICKIVRDADKIDIMNINLNSPFTNAAKHQYLNDEKITAICSEEFYNRQVLNLKNLTTIYDDALKFGSWIFDLNFSSSKKMFKDYNFINLIFDTINIKSEDFKKEFLKHKEFLLSIDK